MLINLKSIHIKANIRKLILIRSLREEFYSYLNYKIRLILAHNLRRILLSFQYTAVKL